MAVTLKGSSFLTGMPDKPTICFRETSQRMVMEYTTDHAHSKTTRGAVMAPWVVPRVNNSYQRW